MSSGEKCHSLPLKPHASCLPCPCLKPLTVHLAGRKKCIEKRTGVSLLFKAAPLLRLKRVKRIEINQVLTSFSLRVSDSTLKRDRKASLIANEPPYILPLAFKGII